MNLYKDLYKKANDSIPSQDAKMRVMAKVQSRRNVRPVRKTGQLATLAACLIFTFAAVNVYNNFKKEQKSDFIIKYTPEINVELPVKTAEIENPAKEEQISLPENTPKPIKKAGSSKKEENKAVSEIDTANEAENVLPPQNDVQETQKNYIIEDNKVNIYANAMTDETGISPALLMIDRSVGRIEEVTISEYYEYIGKEIENETKLPEGFTLITQEKAMLELNDDGSFKNDEWCFVFENEEKSAEIITTKKIDTVQDIIENPDYKKSTVCEKDAVIFQDNDFYKAYLVSEEVGYTVSSVGLSENEVSDLLVSLTE